MLSGNWYNNPNSTQVVDHKPWQDFLNKYMITISGDPNLVTFGKVTPIDKSLPEKYITDLVSLPVSQLSRGQQLLYWINF